MSQQASVGLLVFTELPNLGLCAVLQRRGEFNTEKTAPESWPGGCQVTAHGKLEEGENFEDAIRREIAEELGAGFFGQCYPFFGRLVEANRSETPNKIVVTFAIRVDVSALKHIRLGPDSGGLVYFPLTRSISDITDLTAFNKTTGVPDRATIAMFNDEIEALRLARNCFA